MRKRATMREEGGEAFQAIGHLAGIIEFERILNIRLRRSASTMRGPDEPFIQINQAFAHICFARPARPHKLRQALRSKIFLFIGSIISCMVAPSRFLQEGRFAIVTDVGSGMRWTRLLHTTSVAGADGKSVWS
jgi:hypothetical protein